MVAEERRAAFPERLSSSNDRPLMKRRTITLKDRTRTEVIHVGDGAPQEFVGVLVDIQRTRSSQFKPDDIADAHKDGAFLESIARRAARLCEDRGAEEFTFKRVKDSWSHGKRWSSMPQNAHTA